MREVDTVDAVHSCFFSKGVFRDALSEKQIGAATAMKPSESVLSHYEGG